MTLTSADLATLLYRRMMTEGLALPPVYEKQHRFIMTGAHHAGFVAGIGSGKTWAGAIRARRAALGWIGNTRIKTPNLGIITAPTYDMLRDSTLRTFQEVTEADIADFNKNEMLMTLRNGSEILFRSTHKPERLRGPSVKWWWGDEAALYMTVVRKIMIGRLRQFGQQGYDWITTTPRGRNWVWQVFVRDAPQGSTDYLMVNASSRENVFLDEAIVTDWEREYTGDFALQELGGEFVAFEGLIYSEFDRAKHVLAKLPEYYNAVAGVDWGFANPGVILVGGIGADGQIGIVREMYQRSMRIDEWVQAAVQMRSMYRIERFYCDPASPDNIRAMQEAGLPAEAADNSVQAGIQAVKNRLAGRDAQGTPRLIFTPDAVNTFDEFESYQWAENRHGIRDEPVKAKDHTMDSLRYLVMGVDHPKVRKLEARTQTYA